jgi:tetratricopeptide (TPR) repeat protein
MIRRCLWTARCLLRRPGRLLAVLALAVCIGLGSLVPIYYLRAEAHFRAAEKALEKYRFREAREHLAHCLEVWPKNVEVRLLAARLARQTREFDQADEHLKACRLLQGGTDERVALEQVLVRAQRGETEAVFAHCRSLIEREHPASPLILEALAQGYLRSYRLREAEHCLDLWLSRQPENPQALFIRAWVHEHWDRTEDAVETYRRTLQANPEHDEARLHLVRALLDTGMGAEAGSHLETLARRLPDHPAVLVYRGRSRFLEGDVEAADRLLEQAVTRFPRFAEGHAALGNLAYQKGQLARAEEALRRAVALAPGDYPNRHQLYQTLVSQGKQKEADAELVRVNRCKADLEALRQIISKRLPQAPHDPSLHYELGMIFLRGAEWDQALHWFRKALEHDPGHKQTHAAMAGYHRRLGNVGRASHHRRLAGEALTIPSEGAPGGEGLPWVWFSGTAGTGPAPAPGGARAGGGGR